jgi:PST family polysaccharide transporter
MVIITFLLSPIIIYLIEGSYQKEIILDLKIMSIVVLIGGLNYYYGILGLVAMNYKKKFSTYVLITGIFNIIVSISLVYLLEDIGASLAFILSETLLLILIYNKIHCIKRII